MASRRSLVDMLHAGNVFAALNHVHPRRGDPRVELREHIYEARGKTMIDEKCWALIAGDGTIFYSSSQEFRYCVFPQKYQALTVRDRILAGNRGVRAVRARIIVSADTKPRTRKAKRGNK